MEALGKDACNIDEDVAPVGKKITLVKDACDADEYVASAKKKRTEGKVALLLDRNVVPAGKKKTWGKRKVRLKKKMRPSEKRRCIKKTTSVVGSETHKTKSDGEEKMGSEVLNVDSIIKPVSRLSNTGSEVESDSGNRKVEESGNELIIMISGALIGSFSISFYLSTFSDIVNSMTIKLLDVHPSVNFETIS